MEDPVKQSKVILIWGYYLYMHFFTASVVFFLRFLHYHVMVSIGCESDERLLVAEYMPNSTLAKHLFHCKYSA